MLSNKQVIKAEQFSTASHDSTNHDPRLVLELQSCPVKKKQVQNSSPVWKHFCQNGIESGSTDQGVYCIHCLNNNIITRYREGTSTTSMKNHLISKHEINPEESPPSDLLLTSSELIFKIASIECEMSDGTPRPKRTKKANHSSYKSKVRRFYGWTNNGGSCFCVLCAKNGIDHIYSSASSTSTLKRHLTDFHQCDPDTDERQLPENAPIDLPVEVWESIDEKIGVVTGRVGYYFTKLPEEGDNLFCCFCLKENFKQVYSPQSGLTVLRNHLVKRHNYVGLELEQNPGVKLYRAELDPNLNEAIVNLAKKRANTPGLLPRKYFIRLDDDGEDIYCVFCLSERIKYRYHENGSLRNLRRHLEVLHKLKVRKEKYEVKAKNEDDSLLNTDDENLSQVKLFVNESEMNFDTSYNINLEVNSFEEIETINQEVINKVENPDANEPHSTLNSCRLCGKSNTNFTANIFNASLDLDQNQQVRLMNAIETVTGITVSPTDLKSHLICFICMASLKSAYQFRLNAIENENRSDRMLGLPQFSNK